LAGLDDITVGMVSRYAAKAISTWGTVDDYKYFLPRLLELATTKDGEQELGTSLEDIAAKLTYADWEKWPEIEQVVVLDFLTDGWRASLVRPPTEGSALSFLRDCVEIVNDVQRWLEIWEGTDSRLAIWQLAVAIRETWPELARSGRAWVPRARSELSKLTSERVGKWLQSEPQRLRLERAFDHEEDECTDDVVAALDAFQWLIP
jgi:hypothetical protein